MVEAALRRLRSLPQPAFTFRCPHSRTRTTIRDQLVSHDRRDHACRINDDPTTKLSLCSSHRGACVHLRSSTQIPLASEGVQLSLPSASACIFRRLPPPPPASVSFTFAADLPPPPGHQLSSRIFQCGRPPALVSPASVCILRRTVHRATSVPESFRISRRSRSIGTSVLTLAHVFVCTAQRPRPCSSFDVHDHDQLRGAHVHTRVQVTACAATEHTHCARSYSAFCHRESLVLPSPQEPSCSSFRAFQPELRCTELLPYSREHSLARLAALPTQ